MRESRNSKIRRDGSCPSLRICLRARAVILYSQLTFRFLCGITATWVPCRISGQVVVLKILKVLLNGLAGIKRLGASGLYREAAKALLKFGTQSDGQHAVRIGWLYPYSKTGFSANQARFLRLHIGITQPTASIASITASPAFSEAAAVRDFSF